MRIEVWKCCMQRKHWGADFDHSAMKSEVSSLKVVNWHTWQITTQYCDFSKGHVTWSLHSASLCDFQFLEQFVCICQQLFKLNWSVLMYHCLILFMILFIYLVLYFPMINIIDSQCGYIVIKTKRNTKSQYTRRPFTEQYLNTLSILCCLGQITEVLYGVFYSFNMLLVEVTIH